VKTRSMVWRWLLLAAILVIFFASTESVAHAVGPRNVDVNNDGQTVVLSVGQHLILNFNGFPTNGMNWIVTRHTCCAIKLVAQPAYSRPAHPVPGPEARQQFRFVAEHPGAAQIDALYRHQWEGGTKVVRRFSLTVNVE
jgi:predicted secreted protein